LYQFFATAVLVFHLTFIVFVLGGGLLVLRWPALAWVHIPAVAWGITVEIMAWICPLTPLENHFLTLAGDSTYAGDFIQHYLLSIIYPSGLTPRAQMVLAGVVLVLNGVIYAALIRARWRRSKS
jgi:hypothetical protein